MRRRSRKGWVGTNVVSNGLLKNRHNRQWFDGEGIDEAKVYMAHRDMPEGRTSTLRKRQKFINIMGASTPVSEKERKRHVHPRRLRGMAATKMENA